MDVLYEKIKNHCEEILKNYGNNDSALKHIDRYLMTLYMSQEINGFSKLSITIRDGKKGVFCGIQLPGFHGMNGWADLFIIFPNTTRTFDNYDRAMNGI